MKCARHILIACCTDPSQETITLRARVAVALILVAASASAQPADVVPPKPLSHVDAIYPESALARRAHGDVTLDVTIGTDGAVKRVEVRQSAGDDLDAAAVSAARQWTFRPATRGGRSVQAIISMPFHFAPPIVTTTPTQTLAPPPQPPKEPANAHAAAHGAEEEPEEVQILGRAEPPHVGASDFRVHLGELARVPNKSATELLRAAAPGLLLTNEGGEGHAEQIFLRGFDAREGQDMELTVGGVPINESGNLHGNGYADTHFIIPELVESLRVVEGPFDPRQGNYAVAGSANYELGLEKRGLTTKLTYGSFDTQRLLLLWGPNDESVHTFAGGEIAKSGGFGQNRDSQRASAMGQYEGRVGQKGSWRLTTQAYSTHFHTAGVVRQDDYASGKLGFYDSYSQSSFARQQVPEGGDASRYSIAGDIETRTGDTLLQQQVFVVKRDMRLLENFTGFLLDVQTPLQSVHQQRGDMLDLAVNESTIGARGAARIHGKALGQRQELELGYFARGDFTHGRQQRIEAATGVPYKTENDLDANLGDIGLYGDANVKALPWLGFRGGVRADLFTYDVTDNCAVHDVAHPSRTNPPVDQSCIAQQDFGRPREPDTHASTSSAAFLPRATVIVGPFTGFSFNASYGQGVRSIDPSYITQDVKTPFASITAYELGVGYVGEIGKTVTLLARSIFFETDVDKDLVFSQTEGRNVLGVGTTRRGWVGAMRLTGSWFDEAANVTLVRSAYDDTHLLVAYVPDVVFRSDTALFTNLPWTIAGAKTKGTLSSGITYVGPRALPFGQRSSDIFTVDAAATLGWKNFEIGILSTNLFNAQYRLGEYNYASDFHSQPQPTLVPERHFTAGAPRAIFGTFAVTLGGT